MHIRTLVGMVVGLGIVLCRAAGQLPATDERGTVVRDLNTPRTFVAPTNQTQWNARNWEIRSQALFSAGLWPMPARGPANPRVFDRFEGDGFTVEKVHLQPYPGVYLAGNLYRPLGRKGPFPAMLSPHGHWSAGRLEDTDTASVPGRCIQLARMGVVVFTYDMIGYQDTSQFSPRAPDRSMVRSNFYDNHVALFRNGTNQLWNLSLMGQQVWNSVRALDFLLSLPDVDRNRVGVTGASGGGTQSFLLAAIDDRVKLTVPAVMVSHTMQGGCFCENCPGLRVNLYNVDLAAAAAPRPQLLIAANGDWTRSTLEVEGPDVAKVYELLGVPDRFGAVRFDFPHNYNRTSREALYGWVSRFWMGATNGTPVSESPFNVPPLERLTVFPQAEFPAGALDEAEFTARWVRQRAKEIEALRPVDPVSYTNFLRTISTSWQRALALDGSERTGLVIEGAFGRAGKGDRLEKRLAMPDVERVQAAVVLVHPDGRASIGPGGARERLAASLVHLDIPVLAFDAFQTGPQRNPEILQRSPFTNFFNTYNRTVLQERVQDVITAMAYVRQVVRPRKVILMGDGEAGLWALLAARWADATVVDVARFDVTDDERLISPEWFVPGFRLAGGFDAAAALVAPKPLRLHNTGVQFPTEWSQAAYAVLGKANLLEIDKEAAQEGQLIRWIQAMAKP